MNSEQPFVGYPGQVWATCYQALAWLDGLLAGGAAEAASVAGPATLVLETLRNGSASVDAWQTGAVLSIESQNLAAVRALPIVLTPTVQTYFDDRINGVANAGPLVSALPPAVSPFAVAGLLSQGEPAIAYPGYLEWCVSTSVERAPAALTNDTLVYYAQQMAAAWLSVTNAVDVLQGSNPTYAYDTAARMYRCSNVVATVLSQLLSGGFQAILNEPLQDSSGNIITDSAGNILYGGLTDFGTLMWNSVVAVPTMLLDAASLGTAPATLQAQQVMVVRNALDRIADDIALFLCTLRTSIGSAPLTAFLTNNDTLLDLAAREVGDFEAWPEIARINGLAPPYPGPTNQAIALSGRQLYMPGSDASVGANGTPPTYPDSTMGTDYYFGPINGVQPPWNGDLATIRGLLNFSQALGRRLQTPIGTLVYHHNYGSRIPGEVGAIQSTDESRKLAAFGRAALAADKRTGRVISAVAAVQPGLLATFAGVVQPIGPGATPVTVAANITP